MNRHRLELLIEAAADPVTAQRLRVAGESHLAMNALMHDPVAAQARCTDLVMIDGEPARVVRYEEDYLDYIDVHGVPRWIKYWRNPRIEGARRCIHCRQVMGRKSCPLSAPAPSGYGCVSCERRAPALQCVP